MTCKQLFVGGTFDDAGGRESRIASVVYEGITSVTGMHQTTLVNGGAFGRLEQILSTCKDYNVVYWFANVPNDKEKIVSNIKSVNPQCVLVTSKRNEIGADAHCKYPFEDLLYRAFSLKSNLCVEFRPTNPTYKGRVFDPLGNVFLDYNEDFRLVGRVLATRVKELASYTRVPSSRVDYSVRVEDHGRFIQEIPILPKIPSKSEFFTIVHRYAERLHSAVHHHPEATNRFFGNASFLAPKGFLGFVGELEDVVCVTARNTDKRSIGVGSFVGVRTQLPVQYYGQAKPSVDTPSQLLLYNYYPRIRYMIHLHAYCRLPDMFRPRGSAVPFTTKVIPCGALEEAFEIIKIQPDNGGDLLAVNLLGHGSLVAAAGVQALRDMHLIERKLPEVHDYGPRC